MWKLPVVSHVEWHYLPGWENRLSYIFWDIGFTAWTLSFEFYFKNFIELWERVTAMWNDFSTASLGVFFSSLQAGIGFLGGHLEPSSWLRVELNIHISYDITVVANRSGQHGGENEKWYKHICMEPYVEANQRHKAIFKWLVYESGPARSWIPILRHFDCTFYALPI